MSQKPTAAAVKTLIRMAKSIRTLYLYFIFYVFIYIISCPAGKKITISARGSI
jgi:cbb3-type cytochrome oxidase subunit 3